VREWEREEMIGRGEDEEGRGGDVKRMGKRRKVRLWGMQG